MQSRTSFFNGAVFRKNLSRFAPIMALDALLVVIMIMMTWSRTGVENRSYYFFNNVGSLFDLIGMVNLVYAAVVAQLLFGDLFSSRMCNALHAMPLRRECWFVTNVVSGLAYSLIPTAVGTLVLLPLLAKTIFVGAWKVAFLFFLAANLEFICFFGLAVFSVMMVGSRITMVAGYGLLNFGAPICYWLVNSIYTPLLYGVVTPTTLASKLFPMEYMLGSFVDVDEMQVFDEFGKFLPGVRPTYSLGEAWQSIGWLALAGVVFTLAALILYKCRNLECAGDAVFSRKLVPVFQVLSALFVAVAAEFFLTEFVGISNDEEYLKYVLLFCGLLVGWFAGKMLVERSAQVFQPRSFLGLGILAAVLAVTMGLTKLDILRIDDRIPAQEDVAKVSMDYGNATLEDPADIAQVLRVQELILEDRLPRDGSDSSNTYVLEDGEYVPINKSQANYWQEGDPLPQQRMRYRVDLTYTLKDGKVIQRCYQVWTDSEQGQIVKDFLSRWDSVNSNKAYINGETVESLPLVLEGVQELYCSIYNRNDRNFTREQADALIAAIQADCAAGHMAQISQYHEGVFKYVDVYGDTVESNSISLSIQSANYGWDVDVYADCANTIQWLQDNGYMDGVTVGQRTHPRWY